MANVVGATYQVARHKTSVAATLESPAHTIP